jgi:hypothetical protein
LSFLQILGRFVHVGSLCQRSARRAAAALRSHRRPMGDGGSGAQHILPTAVILLSELATTARRCALAELQAGLACRPACSRSQLRSAGTPPP